MTDKRIPSPEELRKLLRYEPETGKLFWLNRPVSLFKTTRDASAWNTIYAGKEALASKHPAGYKFGRINDKPVLAHRVIYAMVTGERPSGEVDHINSIRDDNRWSNLRSATHTENMRNASKRRDNASGVKGVSWCKRERKWRASITVNRKMISLGYHIDIDSAASAYAKAAQKYYGEFARLE